MGAGESPKRLPIRESEDEPRVPSCAILLIRLRKCIPMTSVKQNDLAVAEHPAARTLSSL